MNARLLFLGMWNFADDCGRLPLSPKTIKAQILPGDEVSVDAVLGMIEELSTNGLLLHYVIGDKEFLQITGWQHQRIDKPQPAKYPAPANGYSKTIPRTLATEGIGEEGKGRDIDSAAKAAGAKAPADARTRLFTEGLPKLAAMTGKGPDACRSFVGKCLKASSDDAIVVLGLIEDAERNRVADPSAWIVARLKPSTGPPVKHLTEHQQRRRTTEGILDDLENFSRGSSQSSEANPRILLGNSSE